MNTIDHDLVSSHNGHQFSIFNDRKIIQLSQDCTRALALCQNTMQIWTHRRSGTMLRNMTIGNEYTPMRQLRQIAAELQHKQDALVENKYRILKNLKKAKIYRQNAQHEQNSLKKDLFLLKAEEKEELAKLAERPYIGAMREVMELSRLHNAIVEQMKTKYGKVDEEIFEREEAKYYIKRIFAQSLRYIRQQGTINTGNQEILEQLGLDPLAVQTLLTEFLKSREKVKETSSEELEKFLTVCAEKFETAVTAKIKREGLPIASNPEYLCIYDNEKERES